jgi:hypothetical protein
MQSIKLLEVIQFFEPMREPDVHIARIPLLLFSPSVQERSACRRQLLVAGSWGDAREAEKEVRQREGGGHFRGEHGPRVESGWSSGPFASCTVA